MDPNFPAPNDSMNTYGFGEEGSILVSDPNQYSTDWDMYQQYGSLLDVDPIGFAVHTSPIEGQGASGATMSMTSVMDPSLEDTDFSETVKFMSQILMDENFEPRLFDDSLSLQVMEKSFCDALVDNIHLSPIQHPLDIQSSNGGTTSSAYVLHDNFQVLKPPSPDTHVPALHDHAFQFNPHAISHTPYQPPSTSVSDRLLDLDSSVTKLLAQNIFSNADYISQFKRGLEEASKFLPPGPRLVTGLESEGESSNMVGENSFGLKGKKNHQREESDTKEGGRSNKQSAVGIVDEGDLSDMFDQILLSVEHLSLYSEHDCLQNEPVKAEHPREKPPSSDGRKARHKKHGRKEETVDLRTLLLLCSQAVYTSDNRTANEILKQIRQHSSPFGDASQRLAHYFANGLEARLAGDSSGAQIFYSSLSSRRITAAEFVKAYHVFPSAASFKKFAYSFANTMIMKAAVKAETLHIIDFGILYGFQWPILIKFLSNRDGGPHKLRITGIEFPQPGFRPTERIEETGRRLANYCKRFNVPFEYNPIASRNWETIQVEDLKIKIKELVAVNCVMRFKNLLDETIEVNSPRDTVLHLIRKINPDIFVQCIDNGSYNIPFFVPRFREALFHFSAFYDMFDTVMPRENEWRMIIEREILGREAMNVIACEGFERVERPETYKQWQVRNTRAGFKQLPLNQELMANLRTKLRERYHRDFVLDEDNNWMLQGWKGRILYASTCWVPA